MITKLPISRKSWLRGENSIKSFLLRSEDQKRCCFGFLAKECGINDDVLLNKTTLACLPLEVLTNRSEHF